MRRAAASSRETEAEAYNARALALTIAKMHGRETHDAVQGETVHLYNWVINHPNCLAHLGTSIGEMIARLAAPRSQFGPIAFAIAPTANREIARCADLSQPPPSRLPLC